MQPSGDALPVVERGVRERLVRIIRGLLTLADRRARHEGSDLVLDPAPRQAEVAALAGTTRATTSRVLRQLAQQGLISASGGSLRLYEGRLQAGDNLR